MRYWTPTSLGFLLLAATHALAQTPKPAASGGVEVFRTSDGLKISETEKPVRAMEAGAQPDILLVSRATPSRNGPDAGALLIYAVVHDPRGRGTLTRVISVDQGRSWSGSASVVLNGWPKDLEARWAVAPAAVQLEDGRVRLFFTLNPVAADRSTPPYRPADRRTESSAVSDRVYSAISNDGLTFAVEDGVRFELAGAANVEVIRLPSPGDDDTRRIGPWLMFLTREDNTILATSKDGLTFERDPTFTITSVGACTAAMARPEGRDVRLWGTDRTGVLSALFDPSTGDVKLDSGTRLAASNGQPFDPAVSPAGDGAFLLVCIRKTADKPQSPAPPDRRPEPREPFRQPLTPPMVPTPKPPPDIRPPTIEPEPKQPK